MPAKFAKLHIVAPGSSAHQTTHRKKKVVHRAPAGAGVRRVVHRVRRVGTGVKRTAHRGGFLPLAPLIPLLVGLAGAAGAPLARDAGNWVAKKLFKSHHVGSGVVRSGATRAKGGLRAIVPQSGRGRRPRVLFLRPRGTGLRRAGGLKKVHRKHSFIVRV